MTYAFNGNNRADVGSLTTFDAIINGERTATTRYKSDGNLKYWNNVKVGDVIQFKSNDGRKLYARVKGINNLSTKFKSELLAGEVA
jgi:hypothetical protein